MLLFFGIRILWYDFWKILLSSFEYKFKKFAHIWNVKFVMIYQEIYFPLLQLCTSVLKISQ
jgi:hypothetical protein